MIEIKNLHCQYGDNKVLKGLDMTINKGDKIAIIGPSGSGKSTLLKSLNYLVEPTRGTFAFDDLKVDFESISHSEIQKIRMKSAMVFQHNELFLNKTVLENVLLPMTVVQKMPLDKGLKEANEILEKVDLVDKKDKYPLMLSGGEQQRVGIGRALAVHAPLLLLDEPTSSLDPELVGGLLSLIQSLNDQEERTMILVSHSLNFVKEIANRIIFLYEGKILLEGSTDYIFSGAGNPIIEKFIYNLKLAN